MSAFKFPFRGPAEHDPYRNREHYRQMYAIYISAGCDPLDADAKALADAKSGRFKHARPVQAKQPSLFPGQGGGEQ